MKRALVHRVWQRRHAAQRYVREENRALHGSLNATRLQLRDAIDTVRRQDDTIAALRIRLRDQELLQAPTRLERVA